MVLLHAFIAWGHSGSYKKNLSGPNLSFQDSIEWADYYYNIHRYKKAIPLYKKNLSDSAIKNTRILKKLALCEASLNNPQESVDYIHDYLLIEFNPSFLLNEDFSSIRNSKEFQLISEKVLPKISLWPVFYFFIAVIGIYIVMVLMGNRKIGLESRILVSLFVFIHSLFMLNLSVNLSNYVFEFPHTYLMSTWSSFLYGPLLFLYFKRISHRRRLNHIDYLHLLPTLLLTLFLLEEVYLKTGQSKIILMLNRIRYGLLPGDSEKLILIVVLKTISLAIYGLFVFKILKTINRANSNSKTTRWLGNIYYIHIAYVSTYIIYGISIILGSNSGVFYHTPILMMAAMVVYIGYAANVQPGVFSGQYEYINKLFTKYSKSGLTASLSEELRSELARLFAEEKLYRKSDINLDFVALKLNTSRHNTSQIINEHFNMGFHEYVNKHRIEEAKELLANTENLNIIDVAYEVGYNNKVTFNKAFKKETQLTPSQFLNENKFDN
ncbi:AraC family transcriptional regulator [Muricauda sp. DJ-13]|uniref:AraC family transcriptional regulator n=2 Tax=Croceivirga thetidis TaxID=2721623 RepID=A0ABX1GSR9_9FLAO|nr:AraC family transcriptional regulator [Croceivirga thetidis]